MAVDATLKRRRQIIIAVVVATFALLMAASMVVLPAYNDLDRAERDVAVARQKSSGGTPVPAADQQQLLESVPTTAEIQGRLNKITSAANNAGGMEFQSARALGPVTPLEGIPGLSKQSWRVRVSGSLTGIAGLVGALRDSVSVNPATGVAQVKGPAPVRIARTRLAVSGGQAVAVIDLDVYTRS